MRTIVLAKSLIFAAGSLALASVVSVACGSGDSGGSNGVTKPPPPPTAELSVAVQFPSDDAQSKTASVHVWAVAAKTEQVATCSALIGGELDPYDLSLVRRADVAAEPAALPAVAAGVLLGPALVYVEAIGFDGKVELAGCVPVDVVEPTTSASVTLQAAGVFDCADPATETGAPCDDGKLCTIGEKCSGGVCKGGVQRDCTYVADDCNAESCDEVLGCQPTPIPDGQPCEDGLFCTEGDTCAAGVCTGLAKDCAAAGDPCQVALGCNESTNQCEYQNLPFGTSCEDGDFCTINDTCSSFGSCSGQPRDCSAVADQCNFGSCDETTDACVKTPKSSIYSCNDSKGCTSSDKCDGAGNCGGTPVNCASLDDQCNVGTCTEPNGTCVKVPVANGTVCDDNDPLTTNDVCTAGLCQGS